MTEPNAWRRTGEWLRSRGLRSRGLRSRGLCPGWQRPGWRGGLLATALAVAASALTASPLHAQPRPEIEAPGDFMRCTESWPTDSCLEALRKYVKAHPAQAFEAGRVVTYATAHWAALPFFESAFSGGAKHASCKDERLPLAVIAGLSLPRSKDDAALVGAATRLLSERCWNELREPILKKLKNGLGYLPENVCPILAAKKETAPACTPAQAPSRVPQSWEALDPKKLEVEGSASVYRGERAQRLTMVKVKGKDYYLVKLEGFLGPWNGKVVLHREERLGDRGSNYWTPVGDARHVSVVLRSGWGSSSYEVYPRGGRGPFHVIYDEKLSKAAQPRALLAELAR